MRLPNGKNCYIDARKINDYCLNIYHPRGKHKAILFEKLLGISKENSNELIYWLKQAVLENDAFEQNSDKFGKWYYIDIKKFDNQNVIIRSVWIIKVNENFPRFVTCYII
ncbi:MAG: hypothetical protein OEZ22_12170 [Spirochaetia bacterium]|nr:hypothetical protein [Spirochaetia bacterium]